MVDKLEVLEVDSLGATIIKVETEVIHEFLPDKVANDVIEVLGRRRLHAGKKNGGLLVV